MLFTLSINVFCSVVLCIMSTNIVGAIEVPLVKLNNGVQYQGKSDHDGDSFRGIRYGQSPEGVLRFAPPLMYVPYIDNIIDATKLGYVCPQSSCTNTGCSEDCLLLNIFTGTNATDTSGRQLEIYYLWLFLFTVVLTCLVVEIFIQADLWLIYGW